MALVSKVMRAGAAKPNPFTICIVANPTLEAPWNSGTVVADPIIGQPAAFQAAAAYIDSALFGLLPGQQEVLLADPAIMPFIRVVSLYDDGIAPSLANALVAQDGASNILVARRSIFVQFLSGYGVAADIVYAVSASASHTRASAWFTTDDDTGGGMPFSLDGNQLFHRFNSLIPGTVGIHARRIRLLLCMNLGMRYPATPTAGFLIYMSRAQLALTTNWDAPFRQHSAIIEGRCSPRIQIEMASDTCQICTNPIIALWLIRRAQR